MRTTFKVLATMGALVAFVWIAAASPATGARAAGTATVTMPADRFVPFAQTVNVGDTVTWKNQDTDIHTVVTVPGNAPEALNLTVKPAATGTFTFTKPGVYWYYCNLHAKWDADNGQVEALDTVDNPAEPMEGTILVLGPGQAPAPAQVVAPGDVFKPVVTTVTVGSTITWTNNDTDIHTVTTVPGNAPSPLDLNLKAGASASQTFSTPGLYWYYCKLHATWDGDNGQVAANASSDEPKEPMMGVVAVLPAAAAATPTATVPAATPTPATPVATATPAAPVATATPRAADPTPPAVAPGPPQTGSGAGSATSSPFGLEFAALVLVVASVALAALWLSVLNRKSEGTQ